jgi:hypothetical protein
MNLAQIQQAQTADFPMVVVGSHLDRNARAVAMQVTGFFQHFEKCNLKSAGVGGMQLTRFLDTGKGLDNGTN